MGLRLWRAVNFASDSPGVSGLKGDFGGAGAQTKQASADAHMGSSLN